MSVTFEMVGVKSNYKTGDNWINFSNHNARTVLALLGEDPTDLYGEISNLDRVIKRAMRVLNNDKRDLSEPGVNTSGFISLEVTDESVRRRIQAVLTLCVDAKRIGTTVIYN